jgi:hypothetical protein
LSGAAGAVYLWSVQLLVPCRAPRAGAEALGAGWYEWSDEARRHLAAMAPHVTPDAAPGAVRRPELPYGWTYEVHAPPREGTPLWDHVEALSQAFFAFRLPPEGLALLCRLFDGGVASRVVRYLLAVLPRHLPRRHPRAAALNLPIHPAEPERSSFPLHADLFRQLHLLTVFDRVSAEETGASIFLTSAELVRVLREIEVVPPEVTARIATFFEDRADHYDELVDLLHRPHHAWATAVRLRLRAVQRRFLFGGGEGYVLDDRRWLHGREPQRCPVDTERLCRVVFDTAGTLEGA